MPEEIFSPVVNKPQGAVQDLAKVNRSNMDFPTAMQAVIAGKKVRKEEWPKEMYVVLSGGFLKIFTKDGKLHEWLVSEGDLNGDDYIIV